MAKPAGASCNLRCAYCFYLSRAQLYPESPLRMSDDILTEYVRQYIEAQPGNACMFAWQGGEPTLMGLDFYRRAVELQQRFKPPLMTIGNAFQTNGVLLNDEWCRFLYQHRFLVGLSLDGPAELHDAWRRDVGGHGSHARVYAALERLKRHQVDFNVLCVVNARNAHHPREVYAYLRDAGVQFIQFIPIVERDPEGRVTPWSVTPEAFGSFLCGVYDEWIRRDVGSVFVQQFDTALQTWTGEPASLCVNAPVCGRALIIEHNGDIYACDHFVDNAHLLGNILQTQLVDLVDSDQQRLFGLAKRDALPRQCRECRWLFACHGACPKDRFVTDQNGEPGLNYLCAGYKRFFAHIQPTMDRMVTLLQQGRAPAEVMGRAPIVSAGRNDPCPCGSGKKFKRCCGR